MSLQDILNDLHKLFLEESQRVRLVLLHPDSHYRSLYVAHLLNSPDIHTVYYALGPDDIDLPAFLNGMLHDLAGQYPLFGRHINMLLPDERKQVDALVEHFARDLAELNSEPFVFILDEYDRSDEADDIQQFVEKLLHKLPSHCRVLINSRTLPRLPWISLLANHFAIILRDNEVVRRDFFGPPRVGEYRLEVFALGPGFVLLNDQPIDTWEGHLPRLLFFFALDRPLITRSEICQAFWPDLDLDQAVNVFHVTKRRLHKALDMDVLVHHGGYYSINPAIDTSYDVIDFVTHLVTARDVNNPNRAASWQRAIDLYRGPFLQGHNDQWILNRRRDYRAGYLEALTEMAQIRLAENRPEQALALYQRAISEDHSREDLHRALMRLYHTLGRRSEAAAHFHKLKEQFVQRGLRISPETSAVFDEIMR